ncbi:hypothetical protein [Pseudoalteromonas sp. OOF1S-7]|uniref:hypothetical protein n=1 Tax=Pseudoalteromonas sp. OOF1S-7 TaxID=2917757 RepID=UPI001EF5EA5B|nr:hypothetical protein [Pseudoalteromonas sp. OOF1S-7]MCG7536580.1 hypothetical protein [Pseudoalteromonas sp. OOF1S-7]
MMKMNKLPLLLSITALASGCSTLLIEVDVYNGPLNSQAPERLDQVAAMVTAARPMLGYIRDTYNCDAETDNDKSEACRQINPIEVDRYRTYPGSAYYLKNEGNITYYLANEILRMYTNEQSAAQHFISNYRQLLRKLEYQEDIYTKFISNEAQDKKFIEDNFGSFDGKSTEVNAIKSFIAPSIQTETGLVSVFCKSDSDTGLSVSCDENEESKLLVALQDESKNLEKILKEKAKDPQVKDLDKKIDHITGRVKELSGYFDSAWLAANESVIAAAKTADSLEQLTKSTDVFDTLQLTQRDLDGLQEVLLSVIENNTDLKKLQKLGPPECQAGLKIESDKERDMGHLVHCILSTHKKLNQEGGKKADLGKRFAKAPDVTAVDRGLKGRKLDHVKSYKLTGLGGDTGKGLEEVIYRYKELYYLGCYESGDAEKLSCKSRKDVKREFQSDLKSFSEKILFLANNLVLLHGNANMDNESDIDESEAGENTTGEQRIKKFIAVLQAIGNSTKVLANDIERQSQFTERNNGVNAKLLKNAIANTIKSELSVANVTDDLAVWLDSEQASCPDSDKSRCDVLKGLKTTLKDKCPDKESGDAELSVDQRVNNAVECIKNNHTVSTGEASELREGILEKYKTQLREATSKLNLPSFDENSDELNTEQVWDSLMYHLAVERVLADKRGDKEKVKKLNKALETARYFRSENSFLRATSDAIRMTMRPTTLLNNSELIQKKRFLNRSLVQSTNAILQKLDNQNWHNINRVAVKGGGDVNYVVAKDDIGNWYIKQYSEQKKEMIESIKSIALFNIKKSNISKLANYVPSGVSEDAAQSTSEKVYISFLNQHTLPLRNELEKQKEFLAGLKSFNDSAEQKFIGLEEAQKKTEQILEDTKELKSGGRSKIAGGVLDNIYLLTRFREGLGDCTNNKQQCISTKQQIEGQVKNSVTVMRQHTLQVEPFVLAFIGAVQD